MGVYRYSKGLGIPFDYHKPHPVTLFISNMLFSTRLASLMCTEANTRIQILLGHSMHWRSEMSWKRKRMEWRLSSTSLCSLVLDRSFLQRITSRIPTSEPQHFSVGRAGMNYGHHCVNLHNFFNEIVCLDYRNVRELSPHQC